MIQEMGVNLLVRQDQIDKIDKENLSLRRAMLASGRWEPSVVFPDTFSAPEPEGIDLTDEQALFQEDTGYDYSGVEAENPEDYERDLALMLAMQMDDDHETVSMGDWT